MKNKILHLLYNLYLKYGHIYRNITGTYDPEIDFIPKLVSNNRKALDVGANIGIYTRRLSKMFNEVEAFEPIDQAYNIVKSIGLKNVTLHKKGISDHVGTATFNIPVKAGFERLGNSSLESSAIAKFSETHEITIELEKLDNYVYKDVDFIKIDVEGHEFKVLQGARQTLVDNKPVLLIEIEQRHLPGDITMDEIFQFLFDLGFEGKFISDGQLTDISQFDVQRHQTAFLEGGDIKLSSKDKAQQYVNNFFFIPKT